VVDDEVEFAALGDAALDRRHDVGLAPDVGLDEDCVLVRLLIGGAREGDDARSLGGDEEQDLAPQPARGASNDPGLAGEPHYPSASISFSSSSPESLESAKWS